MKLFFKQIANIELVSELKLIEDSNEKDSYIFNYRDITFTALQITKPDLTLSRISLGLNVEELLNKVDINKVLEEINSFNRKISTIKIVMQKTEKSDVFFRFSVEFPISDELFNKIDLEPSIKLIMASSKVLIAELLDEEVPEDDIY